MKLVKSLSVALISTFCTGAFAQEPQLIRKSLNDYPVLDGSKAPLQSGWVSITPAEQKQGEVSVTKQGEITIKCLEGEANTFAVNQVTDPVFSPTDDYSIELSAKVVKNNGRGLDIHIRDGKNVSKLICITHNRVILNGEKVPVATLDGKKYHTYRIAVERAKGKMHLYIDGIYKSTVDMNPHGGKSQLSFGKGNVKADTEIVIDYLTYDLTGAYAPKI